MTPPHLSRPPSCDWLPPLLLSLAIPPHGSCGGHPLRPLPAVIFNYHASPPLWASAPPSQAVPPPDFAGSDAAKLISDPQHIANVIRYVMAQPIDLNLQEIVIRPPVDTKV